MLYKCVKASIACDKVKKAITTVWAKNSLPAAPSADEVYPLIKQAVKRSADGDDDDESAQEQWEDGESGDEWQNQPLMIKSERKTAKPEAHNTDSAEANDDALQSINTLSTKYLKETKGAVSRALDLLNSEKHRTRTPRSLQTKNNNVIWFEMLDQGPVTECPGCRNGLTNDDVIKRIDTHRVHAYCVTCKTQLCKWW